MQNHLHYYSLILLNTDYKKHLINLTFLLLITHLFKMQRQIVDSFLIERTGYDT